MVKTTTGFEIADIVRKKNKHMKFCFLSEFRNYYNLLTTEYPNVDYKHFIQKPVKKNQLCKIVKELIGN